MTKRFLIGLFLLALAASAESQPERDARMKWWREARLGLFIHWGLYSIPAGIYDGKPVKCTGEWIMNCGKIPVAVYAEYAKHFNPVKFNPHTITPNHASLLRSMKPD